MGFLQMPPEHKLFCLIFQISMSLYVSTAYGQTQSSQGDCSVQVIGSNNVINSLGCNPLAPIQVNYMRLFNSVTIPLIMTIYDSTPNLGKFDSKQYFGMKSFYRRKSVDFNKELYNEAKKILPFQDAKPIMNLELWRDVSGNEAVAAWLHSIAMQSKYRNAVCFFGGWPVDEGSGADADEVIEALLGRRGISDKNSCEDEELEDKIGFTFAILRNTSKYKLNNVQIEIKNTYISEKIRRLERRDMFNLQWANEYLMNAKSGKFLESFKDASEIELLANKTRTEVLKISEMAPNEAAILLLNVYYPDSNLLPAKYLSGIYKLDGISANGFPRYEIRHPSMMDAARLVIKGFGWAHQ